jgi:hypothetical protein
MVAVSAVAKDFSDRHFFSDRPSIADIEYLVTNRPWPQTNLATNRRSLTFSNQ